MDYSAIPLVENNELWGNSSSLTEQNERNSIYTSLETATAYIKNICGVEFVPFQRTYTEYLDNNSGYRAGQRVNIPPYNSITKITLGDTDITANAPKVYYRGLIIAIHLPRYTYRSSLVIEGCVGMNTPTVKVSLDNASIMDGVLTADDLTPVAGGNLLGIVYEGETRSYTYYAKDSTKTTTETLQLIPLDEVGYSGTADISSIVKYVVPSGIKQAVARFGNLVYSRTSSNSGDQIVISDFIRQIITPYNYSVGL